MKYLCIIQARINSSRLPAKVMLDLAGKTLLERVYETVHQSKLIDKVVVATSREKSDDILAKKLTMLNIACYRGSLDNVLERFFFAASQFNSENVVRITADNPLMDAKLIDKLILRYESQKDIEYMTYDNAIYGLASEVFSFELLKQAYNNIRNDYDSEHVTPYMIDSSVSQQTCVDEQYARPDLRVTVDTLNDYIAMQNFYMWCEEKQISATIDSYLVFTGVENKKHSD